MKLTELKRIVDQTLAIGGSRARDAEVRIVVKRPNAVGGTPSIGVEHAGLGIDWVAGHFLITPEQHLLETPK